MIRVLFIRRTQTGSLAAVSDSLAKALEPLGIEAVIDDASWIPDKTGFWEDRKISPRLKESVKGFDLVHAWGYRTAWACGEALYIRFPWVYSALEWPRTLNPLLIDRLNHARLGICSSRAVKNHLDEVYALNLETVVPSVAGLSLHARDSVRERLGIEASAKVAVCLADDARAESGVAAFVSAIGQVPGLIGVVNQAVEGAPDSIRCLPNCTNAELLAVADALVVPPTFASFSVAALYAMQSGVPLLMRTVGGLMETGVDGIHFHGFGTDEELVRLLGLWAEGMDITGTVDAARSRAESWLNLEESARRHADLYRRVLRG